MEFKPLASQLWLERLLKIGRKPLRYRIISGLPVIRGMAANRISPSRIDDCDGIQCASSGCGKPTIRTNF
jgi:hypothetical protein